MFLAIELSYRRSIIDRLHREAKRVFPCEAYAYLIGEGAGTTNQVIEDIYIPEDVYVKRSDCLVDVEDHCGIDAEEFARESGMALLGDWHSHPFQYKHWKGDYRKNDRAPSEGDYDEGWKRIAGISIVKEDKSGALRASTRFFGPHSKVIEKVQKTKRRNV